MSHPTKYRKPIRVEVEWNFPPLTPPPNHMVLLWTPEYDGGKVTYGWACGALNKIKKTAGLQSSIRWMTMMRTGDIDITDEVKGWCELPDTERLSMTKKTAVLHMQETHTVIYEVEVDADATEEQVQDLANRLQLDLDEGQKTDMTDWDCERVEFIEDDNEV